mmetsp:Transcript_107197/g.313463  ORF Transcript_107197/g.313463 Transcript_107197/m.313463 type:complete len:202 (-) Transcript_107197:146-751(-)
MCILGQSPKVDGHGLHDADSLALRAELKQMLHHVVSVLMAREPVDIRQDGLGQSMHLVRRALLQQPLDHPAAVFVAHGLEDDRSPHDLVNDELHRMRSQHDDAFLNNVVGMRTSYCIPDMPAQLSCDAVTRLITVGGLQRMLYFPATFRTCRQRPDMPSHVLALGRFHSFLIIQRSRRRHCYATALCLWVATLLCGHCWRL